METDISQAEDKQVDNTVVTDKNVFLAIYTSNKRTQLSNLYATKFV